MKSTKLLSYKFKVAGWIILALGLILGVWFLIKDTGDEFLSTNVFAIAYGGLFTKYHFLGWIQNDIIDELIACLIVIGSLLVMFSKSKNEDEFIASLRLNALSWAVFVNYIVLLLSVIFVYDMAFFWVLVFNMFTILVIFILRFYWLLHQVSKKERHEK